MQKGDDPGNPGSIRLIGLIGVIETEVVANSIDEVVCCFPVPFEYLRECAHET
jgi:hypothetical protein